MKERGVLFSASMVRALLNGSKTQTRRPVTLPKGYELDGVTSDGPAVLCSRPNGSTGERRVRCPYGSRSSRLWVRETWQAVYDGCGYCCECWVECHCADRPARERWGFHLPGTPFNGCKHCSVAYRATDTAEREVMGKDGDAVPMPWKPSIFMPRAASRITLEVEHVRLQPVQDISARDLDAEGVSCPEHDFAAGFCVGPCFSKLKAFAALWDSIHSRSQGRQWADNPLVWAISFRVVPQQETIPNTQSNEATT
jgi:hypothetical protein